MVFSSIASNTDSGDIVQVSFEISANFISALIYLPKFASATKVKDVVMIFFVFL